MSRQNSSLNGLFAHLQYNFNMNIDAIAKAETRTEPNANNRSNTLHGALPVLQYRQVKIVIPCRMKKIPSVTFSFVA